ncbi:hypothetical protein [Mesorhizobium sp.]|uniref:hypothetical protein n=1 Tax=Mesorhizobium sp. TaxID=1871066 RepID=UPI00257A2350|nr:hypothetical protein [Mesorhizobium sp.]
MRGVIFDERDVAKILNRDIDNSATFGHIMGADPADGAWAIANLIEDWNHEYDRQKSKLTHFAGYAASLGIALSTNRKNRVLRVPATK